MALQQIDLYLLKSDNFSKPTALLFMPDAFVGFQHDEYVNRYKTNVFAFWKELDAIQRDYFESIDPSSYHYSTNSVEQLKKRSTSFQD
jgi:hypothetical protein